MKTKFICRKPGPRSVKVIQRDQKVISSSMAREYSFVYKKAKGCYIWDADGRRYLDFSASVAVMNIGHTNPVIEKAIHKQIKYGIHSAFPDFYTELPVQFAEKLLSFLPGFGKVFLSNSGTEAVECAYKLARWHSKKKWTIAFKGAFHGRTMGSLSMTYSKPVQRQYFGPFLPVKHVSYPDVYRMGDDASNICLNELERTIKKTKDIASVFIEPIQGEGGYRVPPKDFMRGVRKLCDEHDILLCDDEVQSGCWRTGTFLAIENFRVKPDIISMSKAIGGGIPLGATISTSRHRFARFHEKKAFR
jgi:4-aminobutyrate aminotransferase